MAQEQKDLIEIFKLLEQTFTGKDTKVIQTAEKHLKEKFSNLKYFISLLFKSLSITSIQNKTIPENLHKSILIFLKNILSSKIEDIEENDLFSYANKFLDLILSQNNINPNLKKSSIVMVIQSIITNLLSYKKMIENKNYIIKLFDMLLRRINTTNNENILEIYRIVISLCSSLISSKSVDNNNYEEILNNFYIPIVNTIFSKVPKYIDPKNNIYNDNFICVLKYLYEGIHSFLTKTKRIYDFKKRKEISLKFYREYGLYSLELIQLMPSFDELTINQFGNPNPIIVFNKDERKCEEINFMKAKILKFMSYITQSSDIDNDDNKYCLDDNELVELVNKIIHLMINCFKDILSNKQKYYYLKRYKEEVNEEDDSFNILLFEIYSFLMRSLIREPIKSTFMQYIKQFLLNILFPMIITLEDEKNFLENEPDLYHAYINDITSEFKIKNYRTAGCLLLCKISDKYEDIYQFVTGYCLEMLNYILNEGNIENEVGEYNIYLNNRNDALIEKFNYFIKLDLSLLIILIIKDKLKEDFLFKRHLRHIFINNQNKIHLISSPIIKIKLCKLYNYILPKLFLKTTDVDEKCKKYFIENAVNFLLNNIIQKNLYNKKDEYLQALSNEASETIIELLSLSKNCQNKDFLLLTYFISENLEKNFSIFNELIEQVDVFSFFIVIDQILSNIKINQRNYLFECLNNLSKKFQKQFLGQISENKLFFRQFFNCLNSFLTGKNKINTENKEEINRFNIIFDPILNYIKNPKKFQFYEDLVSLTEEYIKALNGINERSVLVLKNIKLILDSEEIISSISYTFTSTFLSYINKNISDYPLDVNDLVKEILIIIEKSFSFKNDFYATSKIYALLLTLQILNLNPNLPENFFSFLIINSLESFENKEENGNNYVYSRSNINQLSLANISLAFIYKPNLTFKILQKTMTINNITVTYFTYYSQLLFNIIKLKYPEYNPLLGKCIILGNCGIITDPTCMANLSKESKNFLINVFIKLAVKHKREKKKMLTKLMKKEIKCDFIEDENEEEEEEEEEDCNVDFNEKVEHILSGDNNIINSDEFHYFTKVMKLIRENEKEIYINFIEEKLKGNTNIIEELYKIRNIKVKYNDKELIIPRRTVKIIRNNK